ncbi:MAG: hypothetical protein JOZ41_15140 [Chloroflexi bacterium]|nr:hypothetical protein [Chloroflexota bacterium]
MKADNDGLPAVCSSARCLGVRPGTGFATDVEVDANGYVHPGTGGMSVAPNNPRNLPEIRRPRALGGLGKDPVWCIGAGMLGDNLVYRADAANPSGHGFIEPARPMLFEDYQSSLIGTRQHWTLVVPSQEVKGDDSR